MGLCEEKELLYSNIVPVYETTTKLTDMMVCVLCMGMVRRGDAEKMAKLNSGVCPHCGASTTMRIEPPATVSTGR